MTDSIHVEPAHELRPGFALWTLSQDPQPLTTSTGFDVRLFQYPSIPPELLEGAYVDGYLYDGPAAPQPGTEAPAVPPETVPPRGFETGTEAPAVPPVVVPARKPRRSRRAVTE